MNSSLSTAKHFSLFLSTMVVLISLVASFLVWNSLSLKHAYASTTTPHQAGTNYASLVDPFTGTNSGGETFPGADSPFGMVQWSPDTVNDEPGGYHYADNRLRGFSLTHLSGAGCDIYEDFPFTPYIGTVTNSPATNPSQYYLNFSHTNETAYAGYYKVALDDGITTELTTTQRSGALRLTYPAGQTATLLVNTSGSINGVSNSQGTVSGNSISGSATSSGFCTTGARYTVYFYATFSQPIASSGTWQNGTVTPQGTQVSGSGSGLYVTFNTSSSTVITATVGLSFVSVANAQANLNQEDSSGNFDTVLSQSTQTWNNYLGEVQVSGGGSADTATFYTALYHSLLQPNVFSDDNGQYMGFDNTVHTVSSGHAQYANFSGWDIYRSEAQLLALLAPSQASDMAQSMLSEYAQIGILPRWSLANAETYVMVGDPSDPILADFYAFGATNFDTSSALSAMVAEATQKNFVRPGLNCLTNLGYVPLDGGSNCDYNPSGPAATTLEYNTDDFAIAAFAQALGNTTEYQQFVNRAQDWHNLLNYADSYLEPRNTNGSFPSPYDPTNSNGWVEGDGAQYNWMVPFNLAGLFQAEGGNSAIVSRLNKFFTQLNAGQNSSYAWLGNEPSIETPWEYDYAGVPAQTQQVVRRVETTLYSTGPNGMDGNDDLGEMSSWYVWAALGMYPETPGTANLVLASPLFPNITVSRPSGQTMTINAPNASDTTYYVQSLTVNGSPSNSPWLPPSFVTNGGTVNYTLSASATSWGADAANAPPSYSGVNTGNTFFTSLESGQPLPTWNDTIDNAGSPAGGISDITGICCNLTGPELGVRQETAHTGSSALMYSGSATNSNGSDYAYMKAFDFSSSPLPVGPSTMLDYWIYPQSSNSTCVAIDLIFSNGTNLRDSGATDQNGNRVHPTYQCGHLTLNSWNHVIVNLGAVKSGTSIVRLDVGYDQPNSTGGYRGYIDDISIAATNLVQDPSYEQQTSSTLSAPWSGEFHDANHAWVGVDINKGNASNGNNNVWIYDSGSIAAGTWTAVAQNITVQPNTTYTLSVDTYNTVGSIGNNAVLIATDPSWTSINQVIFTPSTTGYSNHALTFTTGANETSMVIAMGYNAPGGTQDTALRVDNWSLH